MNLDDSSEGTQQTEYSISIVMGDSRKPVGRGNRLILAARRIRGNRQFLGAKNKAASDAHQDGEEHALGRFSVHDGHIATDNANHVRQGTRVNGNQKWIRGLHS